jgi:hypothetical protein
MCTGIDKMSFGTNEVQETSLVCTTKNAFGLIMSHLLASTLTLVPKEFLSK